MSDYLSEEEQLSKLRDWWARNGTAIVVILVVIAAGVLGWRWYQSAAAERVARGAELYAEFQAASGDARSRLADELVAAADGTAYPTLALLALAQDAVRASDLAAAEQRLVEAVAAASGDALRDLARIRLARVQHAQEQHDEALKTLGEVRSSGYVAVAQEAKGDLHLARGERAEAHAAYEAALVEVLADDQRALLEIKIADTADVGQ